MDLIDRQALLKQIEIDSDGEPGYYGDTWKFIDTIKNLPPATDTNVATKVSTNLASLGTDCISRQQAIDAIEHITTSMSICVNSDECHGMKRMQRQAVIELANMPTIQPEIIYCKDCKHNPKYEWFGCPMSHLSEKQRPETAWCWEAERRTDDRSD